MIKDSVLLGNDEFDEEAIELPVGMLDVDPDDFYPGADAPIVVPG